MQNHSLSIDFKHKKSAHFKDSFSLMRSDGTFVSILNDDYDSSSNPASPIPEDTFSSTSTYNEPLNLPFKTPFISNITKLDSANLNDYNSFDEQKFEPLKTKQYNVFNRKPERKQHQCQYPGCKKFFTTGGHLARHQRIHTGEKNFPCIHPGCLSRFSRQDNMMQHYRTHLSSKSKKKSYTSNKLIFVDSRNSNKSQKTKENNHFDDTQYSKSDSNSTYRSNSLNSPQDSKNFLFRHSNSSSNSSDAPIDILANVASFK
ncbi:hypothetical protein BB559_003057 [Furculomyces boomerangus]|uniref:C2H2-type domain-containing protein n=1 Tax=Furculomyces boomerangus TaxID=61424 RepID=A0A2T9YPG1_9FUNG|nr:hypothetical protein BB559_003057 [Furculomyces boomerangus]